VSRVLPLQPSQDGLVGQTADGKPVYLRYDDRIAHVALIGKSQFGKTTVLEHLILDDQRRDTGVIVLDAHGDLTQRLISAAPADALERITLVEVNEERAFGLNLYDCLSRDSITVDRTVGNVVEVFKKLFLGDQGWFYPIIEEGLRSSAYVIIANGYTMAEVPLLFLDGSFRRQALRAVANRSVLTYWEQYERSSAREQREKSEPVLNKIGRFLSSESIRLIVSQSRTTIPFQAVMDTGGMLIFRLAGDVLDRETVAFLGMVFLSVLSNVVLERAGLAVEQRRRVHVYLDEYGRFATKTTERMLEEFGKYQFGITVAHQNLVQLPSRRAPSAASLVLFQLDGDDAQQLALQLDSTPRRTKRVPRRRTAPQYKEWDEEIWDSEENKAAHEAQKMRMNQIESELEKLPKKYKILEKIIQKEQRYHGYNYYGGCLCEDHRLRGYNIFFFKSRDQLYRPENNPAIHALFNPSADYFFDSMWGKPAGTPLTRSGLTGVYTNPPILRYSEHREWFLRNTGSVIDDEPIKDEVYEGYYLLPEAAKRAWLLHGLKERLASVDKKWAASFVDELTALLLSVYEQREFYFRIAPSDKPLSPTPPLGQERFNIQPEINMDISALTRNGWWTAGHWAIVPFPEVVEWLVSKVNELESDIPRLEQLYNSLQQSSERLFARHRSLRHHKEYIGEQPEEETKVSTEMQFSYFKPWSTTERTLRPQLQTRHVQWYDYAEELDQTHADRRGEIATELATLPRFIAYCKLLDATGTPHEYRIQTNSPILRPGNPGAITAVRSRSRQHHGTRKKTIEAQIGERQRPVAGPPSDDEPPPIGRRSPRQ
jgi:Type IV secretion-system coupling protein DNA-binding domain